MAAAILIALCVANAAAAGWCVAKIRDLYRKMPKGK